MAAIVYVHRGLGAIATDPFTGSAQAPIWANTDIERELTAIAALYPPGAQRKRPARALRRPHLRHMISVANDTALTWDERFYERRDRALLLLPAMTGLDGKNVVDLRINEVRRSRQQWWVNVDRLRGDATLKPVSIRPHDDLLLCAPCAWIRWLEVLDAHAKQSETGVPSRAGVIKLLARKEEQRWHICRRGPQHLSLDGRRPAFPRGTRGLFRSGTLNENSVIFTVQRRFVAAYPDISPNGYRPRSLTDGYVLDELDAGTDILTIAIQRGRKSINLSQLHTLTHQERTDDHVHSRR